MKIKIQKGATSGAARQTSVKPPAPPATKKRFVMSGATPQKPTEASNKIVFVDSPKPPDPPRKRYVTSASKRRAGTDDDSSRADTTTKRYFGEAPKDGASKAWMGVLVGAAAILLLVGICAGLRASRNRYDYSPQLAGVRPATATDSYRKTAKYEPGRYAQLNGMTMEEWMRIHNTNNAMLKARQDGVKGLRSGKSSALVAAQ